MKNNLKNRVMIRIYIEYFKNITLQYMEYILPGAFLLALFASVSVQNVLNNMPKDNINNTFNFFYIAVRDTEWAIQGVLALVAVWACFVASKFAYRIAFKKIDFIKHFGMLRIRY